MLSVSETSHLQPAVRYSGRRGGAPKKLVERRFRAEKLWPLALIVFILALLQHGIWPAFVFVAVQLILMTALQWMALYVQRHAISFGLKPFRGVPVLKTVRIGTFVLISAATVLLS